MTALCVLSPRVLALRLSNAARRRLLPPVHHCDARARKPRHTCTRSTTVHNNTAADFRRHSIERQQQQRSTLCSAAVAASGTTDSGGGGGGGDGIMTTSADSGSGVPNDFGNFNKVASSVAAERNKSPIGEVIVPYLSSSSSATTTGGGVMVELACGTGQHAAHLAPLLPHLTIQPTDLDDTSFDAVAHYTSDHPNVKTPYVLDASSDWAPGLLAHLLSSSSSSSSAAADDDAAGADDKAGGGVAAVLVVNMTHISPYAATQGMIKGVGAVLSTGGFLFVYGPFKRGGVRVHTVVVSGAS